MTSHHTAPHMVASLPHQSPSEIRYQEQRKQIEHGAPQSPIYVQSMPEHIPPHNQSHSSVHMPNEGHNQNISQRHPTSSLQHNPNYGYYYQQPHQQYHHPHMHSNVAPHQQQAPMQIYAPQNHPIYPPPTAPHLRYQQLPQNTPVYALPAYSIHEAEHHTPVNHFYIAQDPPPNIAPHLLHNQPKIEADMKTEDKANIQPQQQPYKKIATPKTPPTSSPSVTTKRKRPQTKDESTSSRADGEEDGTSVDQALTDDSDSASGAGALSSDDSYEERKRKKKRRKITSSKPKGTVVFIYEIMQY